MLSFKLNRLAVGVLALAILCSVILPANGQMEGIPVSNALVVIADRDARELQQLLRAGGTPSNIDKMVEAAQRLLASSAYRVSTGEEGRFEISAPFTPGIYNASVFAPGYVATGGPASITVDGMRTSQNVTVYLQPSAVLTGRVTDQEGKPIPGIIVAVGNRHSSNYDVTMDDGVFVLDTGLKTGAHQVHAFKPPVANLSKLQDLYGEINLPIESRVPPFIRAENAGYVSFASTVKLEQGKLTVLNIPLQKSDVVSGRVTNTGGDPVSGIAILAFGQNSDDVKSVAITDANGNYTLENDLAPGQYDLIVPSIFGRGYSAYNANLTVPANEAVNFVLQNSSIIEGRVVDANGEAVTGATILAIEKEAAQTDSIKEFLAGSMAETMSDADGRFVIDHGLANGTYIATASFGDVPISNSVELSPGKTTAEIPLEFTDIISIEGSIRDPKGLPIENASVIPGFASVFSRPDAFAVASGTDGKFILRAPVNAAAGESLYDEVVIAAAGYETVTAQVDSGMNVTLDKVASSTITGTVIAQRSLQPPVEIALSRQGTISLDHNGTIYRVGLHTNSRVIEASFDQPAKKINIQLEGIQGTAGMSELTIPKELLSGQFAVALDGAMPEEFTMSENQTHSVIRVSHDHNLQELTIQGTSVVPEFPVVSAIAAVAVAAALAYRRLRAS
jgi:hypothetical protein